jgi:hypothetical protein
MGNQIGCGPLALCYSINVVDFVESGEFPNDGDINGYMIENVGNDSVVFEGKTLLPPPGVGIAGQSFSVGGNAGEIYKGRLRWQFANVGANPKIQITIKFYIL